MFDQLVAELEASGERQRKARENKEGKGPYFSEKEANDVRKAIYEYFKNHNLKILEGMRMAGFNHPRAFHQSVFFSKPGPLISERLIQICKFFNISYPEPSGF